MIKRISIHTVFDGANFGNALAERAFTDHNIGWKWGEETVAAFRKKRKDEGEDDEIFIAAIDHRWHHTELDNANPQIPGASFK